MPTAPRLCLLVLTLTLGGVWQAGGDWSHLEASWVDPDPCPEVCRCQNNQAHCDALRLQHVPRPLSPELHALHLRNNLLRKLTRSHLARLRYLKHLNLKGNRLSKVAPDTFREQRHLVSLSLTENNLRNLDHETFRNLGRLRFLSLRKNKLRGVDGLLCRLFSLQLVNLARNHLKTISHRTFRNNWQLLVLDLHANRISHIHKHAFRSLHFLKYLVLRDNPLKTVQLNFKPNLHLELLDFTNCQLSEFIKGLPFSINDLRLSENKITTVKKDDLKDTKRIRLMVLTSNNIESIDEDAFSPMFQLYDLYLGKNKINSLPKKLPKSVHGIFVYSNNISRIDKDSIGHLHALEYLNVRDNNLQEVGQDTFWGLGSLISLDLSNNNIGDIKSYTFQGNKHLQKLDLSSNPLLQLSHASLAGLESLHILEMSSIGKVSDDDRVQIHPVMFQHMKALVYLDLSNSSGVVHEVLSARPWSLDYLASIEDLNLMEDDLQGLPAAFPAHFPRLLTIKLASNPWHCDLRLLWLANWMRSHTVEFFAADHMVCASPEELAGMPISELSLDHVPHHEIRWKPDMLYLQLSLNNTKQRRKHRNKSKKNKTVNKTRSSKYGITPPRYTSLRERYDEPITSYKTVAPTYQKGHNKLEKSGSKDSLFSNKREKKRKQPRWNMDKSRDDTSGYSRRISWDRGSLLNIHT